MKINNYKAKLAYRFIELLHNNGKSYREKLRPQHEYFFEILIRHGKIKSQTPSGSVILTLNSNLAFQQFAPRTIFNYVLRLKSAGIIVNKVCGNKPDCTIELTSDFKICLPNYNYVVPEFLKTNPLLISLFEKYFFKYKSMPLPGAYELAINFMNVKKEFRKTIDSIAEIEFDLDLDNMEKIKCPQCGASVSENDKNICAYCGSRIGLISYEDTKK